MWLWACSHTDLPLGKHGYSPLFLLLFQITVCFINAVVICFPLLLLSLLLSKWRKAQRTPIDLSCSRDPVPLSQILPCQSFMNAAGGKWPLGNGSIQYAQNKEAGMQKIHLWNGKASVCPFSQLVFHYTLILHCKLSLEWLNYKLPTARNKTHKIFKTKWLSCATFLIM